MFQAEPSGLVTEVSFRAAAPDVSAIQRFARRDVRTAAIASSVAETETEP